MQKPKAYIHFCQIEILQLKIKKDKDNISNIYATFDFKNIPLNVMSNVSFEKYYYYNDLASKFSKMAFIDLCI